MSKEKETSKAMDKKISKKFTYKMDLYTLIEKLKDIQIKMRIDNFNFLLYNNYNKIL